MMFYDKLKLMFGFSKDVLWCLCKKWCVTLCLAGVIGMTIYACTEIKAANKNLIAKVHPSKVNVDSLLKVKSDSMQVLYQSLEERVEQAEKIVSNYQSDADVFIGKASDMFSLWLEVSAAFIGIVIGLSVWNNYKQEKSAEKVKRELECTAQINKIGSIMTCLNSLPDPLLTDSEAARRSYIKNNLDLLYHEFVVYMKLVNKSMDSSDYEIKYVQLVLSVMKIAVLRVQNVFSDKIANVTFYTFSSTLEKSIKGIQDGSITHKELRNNLKSIQSQFDKLRAAL